LEIPNIWGGAGYEADVKLEAKAVPYSGFHNYWTDRRERGVAGLLGQGSL